MIQNGIDLDKIVTDALSERDERAQSVIAGRYGLGSGRRKTLAELGKKYGLTRERVRQIQAASLKSIREEIKGHKEAIKLLKLLERYMKDIGHIRRGDLVAHDIAILTGKAHARDETFSKLQLIADALGWPHVSGGNEDWHITWYSEKGAHDTARKMVEELLGTEEHDFEKFLDKAEKKYALPEPQIVNYLLISKRFDVGPYGDLGADHWVQVNPKTVRDKIYLVLERAGEPLHFSEIASLVNELGSKKRAPATVHNELIKDARFTLVGRGTYAINA